MFTVLSASQKYSVFSASPKYSIARGPRIDHDYLYVEFHASDGAGGYEVFEVSDGAGGYEVFEVRE